VLRLCILAVLWGSGFLFVKLALRGLSPSQVVLGQLALGALVLLITLAIRRQPLPHASREWAYLAGMAVLANIAPYLLFSWSEQRISSGLAGVLSGTTPLLTLLLARAFGVGRLTPPRVLGLALGLAGVVLLAAPWHDGSRAVSIAGVLAALGAAACYAGSYVYARLLLTNRGIEPLVLAAAQLTPRRRVARRCGAVDWASPDHAQQQYCPQRGRAGRAQHRHCLCPQLPPDSG
jgi:drug/metabolite transporter (DMT)-like permease